MEKQISPMYVQDTKISKPVWNLTFLCLYTDFQVFLQIPPSKGNPQDEASSCSLSLLTRVGEFWSGQKDSGMGQCPTGTPVFGFGRT